MRSARPRAPCSSSCTTSEPRSLPSGPDGDEPSGERLRIERRLDVPPLGRDEAHPLALALDDETRRNRLHATGGQARHDLLPEHGRHLVAVEAVENAPCLLRVDEPLVDVARLAERPVDRVARDLVEDHAAHRHLRLEHLEQMPGDRLALAVFVRREQELVGVCEQLLQLAHLLALVRVDDVQRLEAFVDVHTEARPGLFLVLLGDVGRALGQVADVADARLDHEVLAEIARDRLRLRRRLDDHEALVLFVSGHGWSP